MAKIQKLRQKFADKSLLDQALTHRSWINENPDVRETNERLEFLGDAVLEFVVSKSLYQRFPHKDEGYLTSLRANLVNTQNLASVARKMDIGQELFLSKGEAESGGRENSSLLANTVEALIGAIYLDQGLSQAVHFIKENILVGVEEKIAQPLKDPKSALQEKVQAQGYPSPKYQVVRETGPDHSKKFVVQVKVQKRILAKGEGKSKSEAEQNAASQALVKAENKR